MRYVLQMPGSDVLCAEKGEMGLRSSTPAAITLKKFKLPIFEMP